MTNYRNIHVTKPVTDLRRILKRSSNNTPNAIIKHPLTNRVIPQPQIVHQLPDRMKFDKEIALMFRFHSSNWPRILKRLILFLLFQFISHKVTRNRTFITATSFVMRSQSYFLCGIIASTPFTTELLFDLPIFKLPAAIDMIWGGYGLFAASKQQCAAVRTCL